MAAASLADWPADPDVKAIIAGIFTPAMQKSGGMQLKDCVRRLWEAATERGYGDGYLDGMGVGVGAIEGPKIAEASPAPVLDPLPICTLASWTISDPVDAQAPEAALPSTPPVRSLSTTATQTDVPAPSRSLDCAEDKNTCLRCTLFSPPPTPPLRSLMFAFAPADKPCNQVHRNLRILHISSSQTRVLYIQEAFGSSERVAYKSISTVETMWKALWRYLHKWGQDRAYCMVETDFVTEKPSHQKA
ncbi:hypothetical protein B0H11DRAFT_2392602 [Mycena galericulata]|nr:hypothetical protein B0H11DRAFT_2392602 [Mycena galericulata]